MSPMFNFGTNPRRANGSNMHVTAHSVVPLTQGGMMDRLMDNQPAMPTRCHFAPFDEHLNELADIPRWQSDLDNYFATIFQKSILSKRPPDDIATVALRIIGHLTREKICDLARTVYTHWRRMQFRSRDRNVCAREIVALISSISVHLRRMSVHPETEFLNQLNHLCIERLKLTLHRYVDVVFCGVSRIPRQNLFMRAMAVVAMFSHLFHGGQLRYGTALNGLRFVAAMSPWPDAIAILYALLHELGPKFALDPVSWRWIQGLLAELLPLTVGRVRGEPLCQLISAIYTLIAEWYDSTRVIVYHTGSGLQT